MNDILLLPRPRSLSLAGGEYALAPGRRIILQAEEPAALLFAAQRLQAALRQHAGVDWEIAATAAGDPGEIGALLRLAPDAVAQPQGYTLAIGADGVLAEASTPAGIFYAV